MRTVVDDSSTMRRIIVNTLKSWATRKPRSRDGAALRALAAGVPDIIDRLNMPEMNGLQVEGAVAAGWRRRGPDGHHPGGERR
jgi:CheY-like chemotaxis protein